MSEAPRSSPTPLARITVRPVLHLTGQRTRHRAFDLAQVRPGSSVVVHVDRRPHDVENGTLYVLAEHAVDQALHLELHGPPYVVAQWAEALQELVAQLVTGQRRTHVVIRGNRP